MMTVGVLYAKMQKKDWYYFNKKRLEFFLENKIKKTHKIIIVCIFNIGINVTLDFSMSISDLRQVCGFLQLLQFPLPIKLTTMV